MSAKTWKEIEKTYPQERGDMTEDMERRFIEDCFSCYEAEGFSSVFWSPFGDHKERFGECFEVVGRCSEPDEADLCALPMWNIKFQDGTIIGAYPEEIIPSEMRKNGCDLREIENSVPAVIGYAGAWRAIQHSVIDGHDFWLMENDNYRDDEKPFVVIDDFGRVILTHVESDLYDEDMIDILQKTLLPVEKMPDETITIEEMQDYGFAWCGMLPMREKAAYEVIKNCEVFRLYGDETERMIHNESEIAEHAANGGIFGVDRAQWKSFLEKHSANNKEE